MAVSFQKKRGSLPLLRRIETCWTGWVNQISNTGEPAGQFTGYLLTGAALLIVGFLVFAKLASGLLGQKLAHFDHTISSWIITLRAGWLHPPMTWITNIASAWGIIPAALILIMLGIVLRRRAIDIVGLAVSVLGGWGLSEFFKALYHRTRPPEPWLTDAPGYSFPSGHSLISLSLYGYLAYFILRHTRPSLKRNLLVLVLLAIPFFVGISRIYLGVHFPSDVLGGWALAAAWVGVCVIGCEWLRKRALDLEV
jgi:undecaprenyl-diphosphatase